MQQANKFIHWAAILFLAIGMLANGIPQLLQIGGNKLIVSALHDPLYLLSRLGVWKILGAIAILVLGAQLLKAWAYARLFFAMSGTVISLLIVEQDILEAIPAFLLLLVIINTSYFRPAYYSLILSFQNPTPYACDGN